MKIKAKFLVACFIMSALLLTSTFSIPVLAAGRVDASVVSVSKTNTDSGIMPLTVPGYYGVTADVLNVRSGPGTGYSVIGTLTYGQAVLVTSISNGWAKFDFFGMIGYAKADYLKEYKG